MSKDWKCGFWEEVVDYEEIKVPPETAHYNVPNGLKPGVGNIFNIVLQTIFEFTGMNQYVFK